MRIRIEIVKVVVPQPGSRAGAPALMYNQVGSFKSELPFDDYIKEVVKGRPFAYFKVHITGKKPRQKVTFVEEVKNADF